MEHNEIDQMILDLIGTVLESAGFQVVEVRGARQEKVWRIELVLYRSGGIGIDHCADAHRLVAPALEVALDSRNVVLQVSSPGIDRVLKSPREYEIFQGLPVYVSLEDRELSGIILGSSLEGPRIFHGDIEEVIPYEKIKKATLYHREKKL